MKPNLKLSIIIPAYNEEKRLGKTLNTINKFLRKKKLSYELIVVDDGSTDNTKTIAEIHGAIYLSNGKNRGKGYSVRNGMKHARGEIRLFSDADLSTPITELDKFLKTKDDVVIASRALPNSNIKTHQPIHREFLGKSFNFIVRLLTGLKVKDTQCGFKLFRKKAFPIFNTAKINGFSFDVELLYLAKKKGLSIRELPVTWLNDKDSKVSPIKHVLGMFIDILRIKCRR